MKSEDIANLRDEARQLVLHTKLDQKQHNIAVKTHSLLRRLHTDVQHYELLMKSYEAEYIDAKNEIVKIQLNNIKHNTKENKEIY